MILTRIIGFCSHLGAARLRLVQLRAQLLHLQQHFIHVHLTAVRLRRGVAAVADLRRLVLLLRCSLCRGDAVPALHLAADDNVLGDGAVPGGAMNFKTEKRC